MISSIVVLSAPVRAATYTWNGDTANGNWTASIGGLTNWSPNGIPPSTADVAFTLISTASNVNLEGARTVNSLTLGTIQNYTLGGGSLVIATGDVTVNGASSATNHTINVPVTLGAAGLFTINNPMVGTTPDKLTITQAVTDGTNPYGLTVAGSGVLVLTGAGNSLSTLASNGGTINIDGGTVNVRNTDDLNYGTTFNAPVSVVNGGKLTLAAGSNLQINGGASSVLTVDGSTSSVSGASLFTLGNSGTPGGLHVSHGGSVSSSFMVVGGVGTGGLTSTATIDSGAVVTSTSNGAIGVVDDSVGAVTVTDAASTWHVGNMIFGGFNDSQFGGTGTLTVTNSGQAKSDGDTKFYNSASSLIVDKGAYSTAQLESVNGATPTIKITDLTGKTALTLNNTNTGFTPTFAGTIIDSPDGPGSVVKSGGATQMLRGHNTYTGGTTISGGTLQLGIEDALAATGAVTIAGGSTLDIGSHTEHIGNLTLTSGTISGIAGSTLVLSNATVSAGTVSVPISATGNFTKTTAGTVTVTAPIVATNATISQGVLDAQGGIQAHISVSSNGQLKARGTITGTLSSNGSSTVTLTGSTIVIGSATISGTLDVGSQTISFAPGDTSQVSTTTLSGGVISAPDDYQISGAITGYGTIIAPITNFPSGTQTIATSGGTLSIGTFAATDSLSGYTGNLAVGTNPLNLLSSGFTTLGSSATVSGGSINSINGVRVTSGKALSGFGAITGPLDNQGTVTGGTSSNVLHLTGAVSGLGSFGQNVTFDSTYSPGNSPASVALSGNTVFASTSQLKMELGGTTLGTGYDHITDTGSLTFGGTLAVSLINNFTPAAGQSFDLLDFNPAQTAGTFAAIQLPTLATGLVWDTSRLYIDGTLSIDLPGDYNGNGIVDAADFVLYRKTFGQIGAALAADGNGNGIIDTGDLDVWRTNFGHPGAGSGAIAGAAVPEPTTLSLLVAVALIRSAPRRVAVRRDRVA